MGDIAVELAVGRDYLIGIAPLVVGLCVVAILILAVWLGLRVRDREPRPTTEPKPRSGAWQTAEEYGHTTPPDHGPGHQDTPSHEDESLENRDPDEVPRDGHRLMPYELHRSGTRTHPEPPPEPGQPETPPHGDKWSHGVGHAGAP
jgi:hypothetical protein